LGQFDAQQLINQAFRQHGPMFGRGAGRPWGGICERTPAFWVTWLTEACRAAGLDPRRLNVSFGGQPVKLVGVDLTYGRRYYFLCPNCGRRCETVYITGRVGCRKCLRLGYLSQAHRRSSFLGELDRLYSRDFPYSRRYHGAQEGNCIIEGLRVEFAKQLNDLVAQVEVKVNE
jgi:hypothetical protein